MLQSRIARSVNANVNWVTPENILADDGSYASIAFVSSGYQALLDAYNFGFDIPAGSTINRIIVETKGYYTFGSVYNSYTHTFGFADGASSMVPLTYETLPKTTASVQQTEILPALFPSSLTLSKINDNSTDGLKLRIIPYMSSALTWYFDYVKLIVDYTPPASGRTLQTRFPSAHYVKSGYTAMNNPERLYKADGISAVNVLETYSSDYAWFYGFGFDIPTGSTINAVSVKTRIWYEGTVSRVRYYLLTEDVEREYISFDINAGNKLRAVEYEKTFLTVPTVEQINDAAKNGFQIEIYLHGATPGGSGNGTIHQDYVSVTVDYTPPANTVEWNQREEQLTLLKATPSANLFPQPHYLNELGRTQFYGGSETTGRYLAETAYAPVLDVFEIDFSGELGLSANMAPTQSWEMLMEAMGIGLAMQEFIPQVGIQVEWELDSFNLEADMQGFRVLFSEWEAEAISLEAVRMKAMKLPPVGEPLVFLLFSQENDNPIAVINEFETAEYSRQANEAGRFSISFAKKHPANLLIRNLYTSQPKGVYANIYRRGELFDGGVLAETDITKNPITWHLLTNEALLRNCVTPSQWSLEGKDLHDVLADLAEYGFRWWQYNSLAALTAAVRTNVAVNTWHSLADTTEGYDQPLLLLEKDGAGKYKASGTAVFSWDFEEAVILDRIRWKAAQGDKNTVAYRWRASEDNVNWTDWTASTEVNDIDYAEKIGVALTGVKRYLQLELALATTDRTSKDYEGNEAGTTPVIYGVEAVTRYRTDITCGTIGTNDEKIPTEFTYSHENALSIIAGLCEFFGYQFRVDASRVFTVSSLAAGEPYVLKAGETCEPEAVNYKGIDSVVNVLTAYGAGDGLGRLSVTLEEEDSIELYGRRLGVYEDSKITDATELAAAATEQIGKLAYPSLDLQIKSKYEDGRNVLNARVNDYIMYISEQEFTGTEQEGYKLGYIKAERRVFTAEGETVSLGLDTELDNLFVKDAKNKVKRQYKKGKAVAQIPINLIANGGQGHIRLEWLGYADSYIVEHSDSISGSFAPIGSTIMRGFVHAQLEAGTTHYYRVKGVFSGITSAPSGVASGTVLLITSGDFDTTPPAVPTGLDVTTGVASVGAGVYLIVNTLTWTANTEPDIAQYQIFRSEDAITYKAIGVVAAGTEEFKDINGLSPATTYYYKISASDKLGNKSELSAADSVLTAGDATAPTIAETAPALSRGKKMIAVAWTGTADLDLSYYEVQRDSDDAVYNETTDEWEAPTTPSGAGWATIPTAVVKGKTYMDYDVEYDKCYTYRYRAVDTSGNASDWSLGSLWKTPAMTGEADIAVHSIVAEMYKDIRNNLAYTYEGDLDATHPLEKVFWIPEETTEIVACLFSAYGLRFRASSTGASAGGAHSHTVTIAAHTHGITYAYVSDGVVTASAGGFTHTHTLSGGSITTGAGSSHNHSYSIGGTTGDAGRHSHEVAGGTDEVLDHTHSVSGTTYFEEDHSHSFSDSGSTGSENAHTHSVSLSGSIGDYVVAGHQHGHGYMVPDSLTSSGGGSTPTSTESAEHSHDIVYGIYEATTPAGVNLYIDNGAGYGSAITLATAPDTTTPYALATGLNILAHVSGYGWKRIKMTSTRLGSISISLIIKADLTA